MNDSTVILLSICGYATIILIAFIVNDPSFLFGKVVRVEENAVANITDVGGGWDFIGTSGAASVDTYIKKVEGTKLFAFKGAMVVDEHIAVVLKTYADVDTTSKWVDLLQIMETLPITDEPEQAPEPKGMAKVSNFFGNVFKSLKGKPASDNEGLGSSNRNNILLDQPYQSTLSDLVYQYYTLPWPVAPREFLFRRDIRLHEASKSATAQYVSREDDRQPLPSDGRPAASPAGKQVSKSVIRAESPFTNWLFQDLDLYCRQQRLNGSKGNSQPRTHVQQVCAEVISSAPEVAGTGGNGASRRTLVQIESLVDNKGSLPAWFVNYVQRSWPSKTLTALQGAIQRQAQQMRRDVYFAAANTDRIASNSANAGTGARDGAGAWAVDVRDWARLSGALKKVAEW